MKYPINYCPECGIKFLLPPVFLTPVVTYHRDERSPTGWVAQCPHCQAKFVAEDQEVTKSKRVEGASGGMPSRKDSTNKSLAELRAKWPRHEIIPGGKLVARAYAEEARTDIHELLNMWAEEEPCPICRVLFGLKSQFGKSDD